MFRPKIIVAESLQNLQGYRARGAGFFDVCIAILGCVVSEKLIDEVGAVLGVLPAVEAVLAVMVLRRGA